MPTASNNKLPISGSITIEIPKKMLRMDKHDHIKLINTLKIMVLQVVLMIWKCYTPT